MFWNVLTYRGKCVLILGRMTKAFSIGPSDLQIVTFCLHICTLARLKACDDERRELSVGLAWSLALVERDEGFFDRIIVISVEFILRQCFGVLFYEGTIICGVLNRSADFRFAVAERGKEFSSVVSHKFYNTFILVRYSGLCLFAEESLQRINQNLAKANCIKASSS